MSKTLIKNALIVNEGRIRKGCVFIDGVIIKKVCFDTENCEHTEKPDITIDAKGSYLLPGVIDDQVHFREPGLMHKGGMFSESRAAVAGGITSVMEMPNTNPQTTTQQVLAHKYTLGSQNMVCNYSFYMGATNNNIHEILKTDPKTVCGIKIFMGSSTGNMLVDNKDVLETIFKESKLLIATHCEDEETIKANTDKYRAELNDNIPFNYHPIIRNDEACYKSTALAVEMATKHNTRLHVLHLSSAKEMSLFNNRLPAHQKLITAEVCVHHLWFSDADYQHKGGFIKWNPSVKSAYDRMELWNALLDGRLDVIATDHAPHTLEEKQNSYLKCPSGGPLVQHSLIAMLEFVKQGFIRIEQVVDKMCHFPASIFQVEKRGYIREGYFADLVLVNTNVENTVTKENILYKCGWSPFEGTTFSSAVSHTFVNGNLVYENGVINDNTRGMRLQFYR